MSGSDEVKEVTTSANVATTPVPIGPMRKRGVFWTTNQKRKRARKKKLRLKKLKKAADSAWLLPTHVATFPVGKGQFYDDAMFEGGDDGEEGSDDAERGGRGAQGQGK